MISKQIIIPILFIFTCSKLVSNAPRKEFETLDESFQKQACSTLLKNYNTYNLSKLLPCNKVSFSIPYIQTHDDLKKFIKPRIPFIATYTIAATAHSPQKTVTYVIASHNDKKTMEIIKKLFKKPITTFDCAIGEWPSFSNTWLLRTNRMLGKNKEYGPGVKLSLWGKFNDKVSKILKLTNLQESNLLYDISKKANIPCLNGEQNLQRYINDLKATGLSMSEMIAYEQWCDHTNHGRGKSKNYDMNFKKKVSKVLKVFGIKYNPTPNNVSKNTVKNAGNAFKGPGKKLKYNEEQVKIVGNISVFARDCHILTTLLNQLKTHNQIIIVYGSTHWFTQRYVLEKYLGNPTYKHWSEL